MVVQVGSEAVRVSDLLPPDAPGGLDEICRQILLGDAPLVASQRVISRVQIEQRLREFPSTLKRLEIPERVIVTRKRRRLSSAEILTAIESFMAREGLHGTVAQACPSRSAAGSSSKPKAADLGKQVCTTAGLDLQAPVFVTKPDPGLEVKRLELDRVERKTRFLLWTSKEPRVLPFYVTVEGLLDTGESTPPATSSPMVLVVAGKSAKLVAETATLRMTALVTPLQSGVKGQIIRVKNQDTQRVLKAEVVGVGLLKAEFGGE
jgi:hypothetical protein